MKAEEIVKIVILMLVLVSTTNSFAFACAEPLSQGHAHVQGTQEAQNEHAMHHLQNMSENDCHSSIPEKKPGHSHCDFVCFCEQATHSPNIISANGDEFITPAIHSLRFAVKQSQHLSINIKPPTPPPTHFHFI